MAGVTPIVAQTTPFESFEDFDDDSHYAEGGAVPDGWKSEGTYAFARTECGLYVTGFSANSGDYCLYAPSSMSYGRNEVVYTPLMKLAAGKECRISLWVYAPGNGRTNGFIVKAGTAQSLDAQTIAVAELAKGMYGEWTEIKGSFTPEAEGEYCFSIAVNTSLGNAGWLGIDDVEITGESPAAVEPDPDPELEPDPENEADAVEIPYIEDFEGDNYDGTSYVPNKWQATGSTPFVTLAFKDFKANSGDWYLVAQESSVERDEHLYTPFFVLTAGTEYTLSYYLYLPGHVWGSDGVLRTTDVTFTVGTQQESVFHKSLEKIEDYANTAWERREVKFTPEKSGAYCFSFALTSESAAAGPVCIDDFSIMAEGLVPSPKAKFAVNHIYDVMTSNIAVYPNQKVQLVNLSQYGEEYEWSVDNAAATFDDANAKNPTLTFAEGGEFKVTLTAKNSKTERSTTRTLNVSYFGESGTQSLASNGPDDKMITRGEVPVFPTGETDFVTGPNHYYRQLAERWVLPGGDDIEINIDQITLAYVSIIYKQKDNSREEQFNTQFELVVYGETDGKLDESKVFGRYEATMAEVFGTSGVGSGWGEWLNIQFPEPIKVNGNCYIAILIDDAFDIEVDDAYVGASCMGLVALRHASEETTMYAKPTALPETSRATIGEWNAVDLIDPTLKGYGIWANLWVTSELGQNSIAVNSLGDVVFDVRVNGDNLLVSGTRCGETVRVYDVKGALMASVVADGEGTVVPAGHFAEGIYIVKTEAGVRKIVK